MDKPTEEGARARLEAMQRDLETKVAAVREEAANASAERKQELEKRLVDVQADYRARTAKHQETLEQTRENLDSIGPDRRQVIDAEVLAGRPPIERVDEGMTVVDSAGKEIGKVTMIRLGDPEALTLVGQYRDDRSFVDLLTIEREPDVPTSLQASLIRLGYVKVKRGGPLGIGEKDYYVRADWIANVSGDRVTLTVPEGQLPDEEE